MHKHLFKLLELIDLQLFKKLKCLLHYVMRLDAANRQSYVAQLVFKKTF